MANEITIPVRLSAGEFRRFAYFNTFQRQKKWQRPVVFMVIFVVFSLIAFFSGRPQSPLLGGVLLVVGLGLPLSYFGTFFVQVSRQIRSNQLKKPRLVYTLRIRRLGVHIQREQEDVELAWEKIYAACRVGKSIYLYATPERAFLIPGGQGTASPEKIWAQIVQFMPKGRCYVF